METAIKLLNIVALMAIMLAMGLQVRFEAVMASTRPPRRVLLGLLANFALVPIVAVLLLVLFQANALVCVGFLILAVCPGTGQQDMLSGLRHRAIRYREEQDGTVHLRCPGNHVLDVIRLAGAEHHLTQ